MEALHPEGQAGDRSADHCTCEKADQHQTAAYKTGNRFGKNISGLFRANREQIFAVAAAEIITDKDPH